MLRFLLDMVYPRTCLGCMRLLAEDERDLCGPCRRAIERFDPSSAPARAARQGLASGGIISDLLCLYMFEDTSPLRPLIHALKCRGFPAVGIRLGEELGRLVVDRKISADIVVPIPLSKTRQRERGFNQASAIAEGLSRVCSIPLREGLVIRTGNMESHSALSPLERRRNMAGAFATPPAQSRELAGKRCLLIDDVVTTGATVCECASVLRAAGVADLIVCAVALARHDEGPYVPLP